MKIRPLKYSEIPKIVELHKHSIVPIWRKLGRPYYLGDIKLFLKDSFKKDKIFVIDIDGKIVACGSLYFDMVSRIKTASIGLLLVSRKEQKKGYGKKMIEFLEGYAKKKKTKEIFLDVLVGNPAVKFYKHLGYKDYKFILKKEL